MNLIYEILRILRKYFYVFSAIFISIIILSFILLLNVEKHNLKNYAAFSKNLIESIKGNVDDVDKLLNGIIYKLDDKNVKLTYAMEQQIFKIHESFEIDGRIIYIEKNILYSLFIYFVIILMFVISVLVFYNRLRNKEFFVLKEFSKGLNEIKKSIDYFQNYLELNKINENFKFQELNDLKDRFNYLQEVVLKNEKEIQDSLECEEKLRKDLEKLNNLLMSIYEILIDLNPDSNIEEVSQKILEKIINLFEDANAGSIVLKCGENYRFYAQVGYGESLKEVVFTDEEHIVATKYIGTVSGKVFEETNRNTKFEDKFNEVGSSRIKSSYIIPIFVNNKRFGGICIDSFINDKFEIPDYLSELFGKIFGTFLYLKIQGYESKQMLMELMTAFVDVEEKWSGKKHSYQVAEISRKVAEKLNLDSEKVFEAAYLHDIGKLMIDRNIIRKPGRLTSREIEELRRHVEYGYMLLNKFKLFKDIAKIVLYHHERCDGKGYPKGLKCNEIPIESRIINVVDVYQTLILKGFDKENALKILKEDVENGKFDGKIVEILVQLSNEGLI